MDEFIDQPVVSAFLMVELASFKVTMKTACADLCTNDSRVYTTFCAVQVKSRVKDLKISIWDQTVVS